MSDSLAADLRQALIDFVTECGTRRSLPVTMRIGTPGGEHAALPHDPTIDPGLRTDVVERVLDATEQDHPIPWLTRGGDLSPGDVDFAWFAASRDAFARHGLAIPHFFVMTRSGWLDLVAEEVVQWKRVRKRGA